MHMYTVSVYRTCICMIQAFGICLYTHTHFVCVLGIYICVDAETYFLEFRSYTNTGKALLTEEAAEWKLFGLGPLSVLFAAPAAVPDTRWSLRKCLYHDSLEFNSVCVTVCVAMQIHTDAY